MKEKTGFRRRVSMDISTIILEETYAALQQDLKKEYKNADPPNAYIPAGHWKDKQIKHALNGYAAGCRLQDAVVLCDTTIFGSATKGFLFSTEGVYSNDFNYLRKKSPLTLPVRYADLAKVHADYKDSEMQLTYKDGRTEAVYTGIYTGFIVTSLQNILLRMRKEFSLPKSVKTKAANASKGKKPTSDEPASNKPSDKKTAPSNETASNIRKNLQKILIADGSSFSRVMLKDILNRAGYEICGEAANGKEAVEMFKKQMPGLTILDVNMPEMDGIEALKQIKEYSGFSYVIMLDASHSQEIYDRCANAYANRILYKPVRQEELIKAVRDLLAPGWDWKIDTD